MITKEITRDAVARGLQATSEQDVVDVLLDLEDQHYANYPDPEINVDLSYELATRRGQIIFSCLEEQIALKAVTAMNERLAGGGRLIDQDCQGEVQSQSLCRIVSIRSSRVGRALRANYGWIEPAFAAVRDEAKQGRMPAAALMSVGQDAYTLRRWSSRAYVSHSPQYWARFWRKTSVKSPENFADYLTGSLMENSVIAMSLLTDKALGYKDKTGASSRSAHVAEQLDHMSYLTSGRRRMSASLFTHTLGLLNLYARWVDGKLSNDEFEYELSQSPPTTQSYYYDSLANGPLEKIGRCAATTPFTQPALIAATGQLLRHAGVSELPKDVSMAHVYLASGKLVCDDSIFLDMPV